MQHPWARYGAAFYLVFQSLGALAWWAVLLLRPDVRSFFRPANAPEVTLLAFWLPDLVFFIGAALWSAHRLIFAPRRALLPLALHVGGAAYAALFCLEQWRQSGEAPLAAIFMAPSLVVAPFLLRLGRVLERE